MSALTASRQVQKFSKGDNESAGQKGNTIIFAGGIVMFDANGFAIKGQTVAGCYGAGVALTFRDLDRYDATATGSLGVLADGVQQVRWDEGIFHMTNSASVDAVLSTTVPGTPLFVVDDQTIALTSGAGTRSPAGRFHSLDADGSVWVMMGKAIGSQLAQLASLGFGAAIASAATIAPTLPSHHVTGVAAIGTITPPPGFSSSGGAITFIPDGIFTTGTGGNIALASTAVVGKAMIMTYDPTALKWYPSY